MVDDGARREDLTIGEDEDLSELPCLSFYVVVENNSPFGDDWEYIMWIDVDDMPSEESSAG